MVTLLAISAMTLMVTLLVALMVILMVGLSVTGVAEGMP